MGKMENMYWNYFKYVMEHKVNVFKTCWKRGLYLHAFTHDMSKLSMDEFFDYAKWFYGPCGVELKKHYPETRLKDGLSCISRSYLNCRANFDDAYKHHYRNNKHHWEYWVNNLGVAREMPRKYIMQMIADWEGMALKFGDTAQEFYLLNCKKMNLERNTRLFVELFLGINPGPNLNYGHTLLELVNMYDEETYNSYFGHLRVLYEIDTYNFLRV
jgi:hypothetical protein